jgi:lysophospholipase L1-like esterase
MDSTPNLQLPYLMAAQAQKHVTHNDALRALDALVQLAVLDKDLTAPPGSPADGSRYIVAASPSGAWTGQAAKIAAWQDGAWAFYVPREGWRAWVADEDTTYAYTGAAWVSGVHAQDFTIGQQATGPRVVAVGDSLTVGFGASAPYTSLISYPAWNGQSPTVSNIGVSGRTMLDIGRLIYSNLNPLFACESGLNVAIVWAGTNDIALGASPADTYSYLAAACRRLRGQGWRVIVCTMISRTGNDTGKNTFNGYIRGGWVAFADTIADLAADANIGADGAYASSTYFQADGTHLKDAGLTIVAGIVQAALTTLAQGIPNWLPPFGNAAIGAPPNNARLLLSRNAAPIPDGESNNTLHVAGADGLGVTATFDAFGGVVQLQGRRSRGTAASPTALLSGDIILTLAGRGYGATGYASSARGFLAHVAAENWTDTAQGTHWDIYTTPVGTTGIGTRRVRVTDAGDMGIDQVAPVCKLDVNGAVRVKSYTVATLPSAAAGAGQMIYVSDETGGAVLAFSDGTDWRRVTDRAVVS